MADGFRMEPNDRIERDESYSRHDQFAQTIKSSADRSGLRLVRSLLVESPSAFQCRHRLVLAARFDRHNPVYRRLLAGYQNSTESFDIADRLSLCRSVSFEPALRAALPL